MSKKLLSALLSAVMAAGVISSVPVSAEDALPDDNNKEAVVSQQYGDLDGDGEVNIKDTTLLQKKLAGFDVTLKEDFADVNNNGETDLSDATLIQKYVTHMVSDFPASVDNDWRTSSIGYEIFIRSFYDSNNDGCGDFRGIAEKVDYLKSLNVGVVWLMPFNKTNSYHGYDIVDYMDVCSDYGTIDDFKYMLETLHNNGIKVLMDLVVNHTSNDNQWFKNSKQNIGNYRDFYLWKSSAPASNELSNWLYDINVKSYYYYCFNWQMPDLNYNNKDVWKAVEGVADYWLDLGIDGFRLDAAMHIDDNLRADKKHEDNKTDTVTHKWWQHFESYVKSKNPNAFCVGEVWPEVSMESTQQRFFADLDSDFDFYLKTEMINMAKGSTKFMGKSVQKYLNGIEEQAAKTPEIDKTTINSIMLSNHDLNRAAYELDGDKAKIKQAATIMMTLPGMPWIYYGDEIGQSGGGTTGADDVYRREPMDWYKARYGTGATRINAVRSWGNSISEKYIKSNDGISVEEENGVKGSILEHYKKLAEIRNKYKIFYTGKLQTYYLNRSTGVNGYSVTDESRDYSMFVVNNNKGSEFTAVAQCDFTDELSGVSYKAGDTVTIPSRESMIIKYTDTVPFLNE